MTQMVIIADDLTGATDTGVQFCQHGFKVVVIIDPHTIDLTSKDEDVWAINVNTRSLTTAEAYRRVYDLSLRLKEVGIDRVYKKIDSTLRGHPGAELEAVMDAWQASLALVVPAFPANRRVTRDGYLIIAEDANMGDSGKFGYGVDGVGPQHIPTILQEEMKRSIGQVDLATVRQGVAQLVHVMDSMKNKNQVLVLDAVDDKDLDTIARLIDRLPRDTVIAGSAGLAGRLTSVWSLKDINLLPSGQEGFILFVIGSYNPVTSAQVGRLAEVMGIRPVEVNTQAVIDGDAEAEIRRVVDGVTGEPIRNGLVVVAVSSLFGQPAEPNANGDAGQKIGLTLGSITSKILATVRVKALMVSGGNTALQVCHSLGVKEIKLTTQILPGIPLGYLDGDQAGGLPIVTKAGGFGSINALIEVFQCLNGRSSQIDR